MDTSVSKDLISQIRQRLPDIPEGVYQGFAKEEDFINIAVRGLDNLTCDADGQTCRIQVKELHRSPIMEYDRPSFVRNTNPELGDMLYIINYFEGQQVVERRVCISQAKFSTGSVSDWKSRRFEVPMHQFTLLEQVSGMRFTWKGAKRQFTIPSPNKSLRTYVFATDFLPPFFQTVDRMKWYLWDKKSDPSYYLLPRESPWDCDIYKNRVIDLISRRYGQAFEPGDVLYEFLTYMFTHARPNTFNRSRSSSGVLDKSGDPVTDGGVENQFSGMAVVCVDIGLEEAWFLHDEGPDEFVENDSFHSAFRSFTG